MQIYAHAKINWSLAVTGRRPDGYHLLDSLMQTITLHDTLTLAPDDAVTLSIEGMPALAVADNLVLRAARLLVDKTKTARGARIVLTKRIPAGAGLGGGSADAAATLLGLNALWELGLSINTLSEWALALGADVPFCLRGGLARVRGIGEEISPLAAGPSLPLVVLWPGRGLSTPTVYRQYDAMLGSGSAVDIERVQQSLLAGDMRAIAAAIGNDLQPAAVALLPEINGCLDAMREAGAVGALMTGSGSAVFGLFDSTENAEMAAASLRTRWPDCWAVQTND